jgi:phosphate:Na+ symporter
MQVFPPLLAGLGLFFCGVHFLSTNLTPLIGRQFRSVLMRVIRTPLLAVVAGIAAGVLTQSTNAVTYVVIGLVSGGVVDKRRAIIIPTWAHVGTAVLVILVAIDFKVAASYLLALAGFAVYFGAERTDRTRHIIGVVLGLGLLFFGLDALKSGAQPLRDYLISGGVVAAVAGSPIFTLLLGIVLTVICQSSTVVGAITVAATSVGIFSFDNAVWLLFGSNLGSGLNYVMISRTMQGDGAQISLIQGVQKVAGFVFLTLAALASQAMGFETLFGIPALLAHDVSGEIAIVFFIYQVIGSAFCTIFLRQIVAVLEWLAPPSLLQEYSRPAFLIEEALVEPNFAIELVGREEKRLIAWLPAMLDEIRPEAEGGLPPAKELCQAGIAVTKAMATFMEQILSSSLDKSDRERVVRMQHRTANLAALFEALQDFVVACRTAREWASSGLVADQMVESLHSLLSSLVEATESEQAEDLQFLLTLLGHRDEIMEKIRQRVTKEDPQMPITSHNAMFTSTMLFERIIWLARRNATLLAAERPGFETIGSPVTSGAAA